jgi:hypothetical protein
MTRWKYDAAQSHPLVQYRIPVVPGVPLFGYIAALSKDSVHYPTEAETRLLVSFIEFRRETWFASMERAQFNEEPFDIYPGTNTVIFHKYGTSDWAYRRRMWEAHRLTPPSPRVATRQLGPMSLEQVMDLIHHGENRQPKWDWMEWKRNHPEVFPNASV